ncbi:DUF4124 domain-containing protein [Dokdonella sp.]|uniref:DUF4124 domain-containing protein n=1 Tax=Dokdonella sp. TaxID=2291710 RepID=UPI001B013E3D|nr:DUF4124 domain-containing protein [Dokdonella sp.]MBO9665161.1 DUF4124 domain-containing protein [Dokdonella sp.]
MKRFQLVLALLVFAAPVAATEMYSWTDANGVKHFSDSPPPANVAKAKKLKVKGGVTSTASDEEEKPADKNAGPALAAAAGYAPEDIKRNCEIARKNLANLDAQKLPLDANGQPVDAEAAKSHQAQVEKTNQQIKLFCAAH